MVKIRKNILLGVSGGIAAYKAIDLSNRLCKLDYDVKTIMTKNAQEFVTSLSFKTLTKNPVYTEMFQYSDPIPHISLADWADLMVIAPATADIMAKAAHGIADDLLSTAYLSHTGAVLWVPSMNVHMLEHPATQENIRILRQRGDFILEPESGMLACGYEGKGKYPPNEEIIYAIKTYLEYKQDYKGKKLLITAGATEESLDPMRYISNRSSGKMGLALARAAALRGAEVCFVHGNLESEAPYYLSEVYFTRTAAEMHQKVLELSSLADIIIMNAAVSDFTPLKIAKSKIKKSDKLTIELQKTPDILFELGLHKKKNQLLVGFAAEAEELIENARQKLISKNLDWIAANLISVSGKEETEIILLNSKKQEKLKGNKFSVAHFLLNALIKK